MLSETSKIATQFLSGEDPVIFGMLAPDPEPSSPDPDSTCNNGCIFNILHIYLN